MAKLDALLTYMKENGGSDLHIAAGLEPRVRISGQIQNVPGWEVLDDPTLRSMMQEIAEDRIWGAYCAENDSDFAYGLEGVARFRANYFVQERGAGAVFRIIPEKILPLRRSESSGGR